MDKNFTLHRNNFEKQLRNLALTNPLFINSQPVNLTMGCECTDDEVIKKTIFELNKLGKHKGR